MGAALRRRKALGSDYGITPAWAWHYTPGRKIPQILMDGHLSAAWKGAKDFPAIWFTTSQEPDPTSSVALSLRMVFHGNREDFKRLLGGFWRIGISVDHQQLRTYGWALETFPPSSAGGRFLRTLDRCGENRNQWRVALEPVPISSCCIQEQKGTDWVEHARDALSLDPAWPGYGIPGTCIDVPADAGAVALTQNLINSSHLYGDTVWRVR